MHDYAWSAMHVVWRVVSLLTVGLTPVVSLAAEPLARSVLILDQSDAHSAWYTGFSSAFRSTLNAAASGAPISIYAEHLDLSRFRSAQQEDVLRTYLRDKFRQRPIGVVVAQGSSSLEFVVRSRAELWSGVPVVFAGVDEETAARLRFPSDITGTIYQLPFRNTVTAAQALVPNLKRIALVGDPWERQAVRHHYKDDIPVFAAQFEFIDLIGLPMAEIRKRVAALPEDTAIIYTSVTLDGAGATYIPHEGLAAFADVANRPIVIDAETNVGHGGTGGFVATPVPVGEAAARLALRIFAGESASQIPITRGDFTRAVFDWRQLQRFGISESWLPPGSEVRFRPLSMWEQYRWQMIAVFAVLLVQAAMISGLLFERHRRQLAELESRRHFMEMAHMSRTATAGALSASIAHELNQPLGAILSNAEAAEVMLTATPPNLALFKEILVDIRQADQRASKIIRRMRELLKKSAVDPQPVDLNDAIGSVLEILHPEAVIKDVALIDGRQHRALLVRADPVHLQQVVLNLAMNGMDAMANCAPGNRRLAFQTALNGRSDAEISVSDSGTGIPEDKLKSIFEPFFTTKQQGMGLGLSIVRTIVETYGGRIWAENRLEGGAVFRFTLPLVHRA
jgi:signal transduction histidine kinase